ncbi:putative cyclic di-GMP phosphodiesterase YliE domain protein, partial [Escherichia coli 174750]
SDDSNNSWNPAYNCFDRPGKKCISFTLRTDESPNDFGKNH